MYDMEFIESSFLEKIKTCYFAHLNTKENIKKLEFSYPKPKFTDYFLISLEKLSKSDWKLHKELIKEGVNPRQIAKILRNDDLEKLQEISTQDKFDFNQIIQPSLYEKYEFINKENVTLIDYAAFFGSIKCFRFLKLNGANMRNTFQYAIAGGNIEIIHLCEEDNTTFENIYNVAIEFHRNDIFRYLYEKKTNEISNLTDLGVTCIQNYNYEIFSFLVNEGMEINHDIIYDSACVGNTFLVQYFLDNVFVPKIILNESIYSENLELIEYLLNRKNVQKNATNDVYFDQLFFR